MATFAIKYRDTRPILEVALVNPDGTAHDLTGSTAWKLHIRVSSTVTLTRDMLKTGLDTAGILQYAWVAADWDPGGLPSPGVGVRELPMEYEVVGGSSRMTFPNVGYDSLKIYKDIG
jgi:hypothetical protein